MKYFIDTEFIEGFHKPFLGKRRHFIDLISIGIVCEDGREYYAISNEFNPKNADQWVKDNVIAKLPEKKVSYYDSPREKSDSLLWKSNAIIAKDIVTFINNESVKVDKGWKSIALTNESKKNIRRRYLEPEFYAYYADYDWVLFCSIFGRMIDLPKGFPMYCRDLKQALDEKILTLMNSGYGKNWLDFKTQSRYNATFDQCLDRIKNLSGYPIQTNEHNALDDARWNKQLYEFLQTI